DNPVQLAEALAGMLDQGAVPVPLGFDAALAEVEALAVHSRLVELARRRDARASDLAAVAVAVYGNEDAGLPLPVRDRLRQWLGNGVRIIAVPGWMNGEDVGGAAKTTDRDDMRGAIAKLADGKVIVLCHTLVVPEAGALDRLTTMLAS